MTLTLWRKRGSRDATVHAYLGNQPLAFFCGLKWGVRGTYERVDGLRIGRSNPCDRCFKEVMRQIAAGALVVTVA
jgi:hypothetical protein